LGKQNSFSVLGKLSPASFTKLAADSTVTRDIANNLNTYQYQQIQNNYKMQT